MENLNQSFQVLVNKTDVKSLSLKEILSLFPKTLLFFYPKDDTPGCTLENKDFSLMKKYFNDNGINLIGVSKDNIESHKVFCKNNDLENSLISDPDLVLHNFFGAYGKKNNYGKLIDGVIRTTILLDSNLNILKSWNNVKASGHVERVMKDLNIKS